MAAGQAGLAGLLDVDLRGGVHHDLGHGVVGEFGDTLLFCAIAAPVIGIDTTSGFINYVVVGFVWKTLIEVVLLPITSTVIKLVKKREDYRAFDAA